MAIQTDKRVCDFKRSNRKIMCEVGIGSLRPLSSETTILQMKVEKVAAAFGLWTSNYIHRSHISYTSAV